MDTSMTFTVVLSADALALLRSSVGGFAQDGIVFRIVQEHSRLGARKSEIAVDIFVSFGTGIASSLVAAAIYSLVASYDAAPPAPECRVVVHEKLIALNKKKEEVISEIEIAVGKCR